MNRIQALQETSSKKLGFREYIMALQNKFPDEHQDDWFEFLLQILSFAGNCFPTLPPHMYTDEVMECMEMSDPKAGAAYNAAMAPTAGYPFGVYFGLKTTADDTLEFTWFNTILVNKKVYAVDMLKHSSPASYYGCPISKMFLADALFQYRDVWSLLEAFVEEGPYKPFLVRNEDRKALRQQLGMDTSQWHLQLLLAEQQMAEGASDGSKDTMVKWFFRQ